MWSQLTTAFNVVGEAAASATSAVLEGAEAYAGEAGRMAKTTKLHAEIAISQHSIDSIKRTWGYDAFDSMVAGDIDAVNSMMRRCKAEIDELQRDIDLKKREIAELEEVENPEDAIIMPPDAPAGAPSAAAASQPPPARLPPELEKIAAKNRPSVAAPVPVATIVEPEPEPADADFQEIGLSSPPAPSAAAAGAAGAAAGGAAGVGADPLGAAAAVEPAAPRAPPTDDLDAALLEADEALGPPPVEEAPPLPPPAEAGGDDLDDEFRELMKSPDK